MIPRRYVIAGLGILLAIVLAVILRPNGSDDANQAAEPVANVEPARAPSPKRGQRDARSRAKRAAGARRKPRRRQS